MTRLEQIRQFTTSRLSVIVAIPYAITAWAFLQLAFLGTNASPVWPPSGVAFLAIWYFGYRVWPGILAGALLANYIVFTHNGWNPWLSAGASTVIGIGNSVEALIGVFLLRSFIDDAYSLARIGDVFKFVFSALVACTCSATIGTSIVYFCHPAPAITFDMVWFTWWLGDVIGILVVASTFLTFHRRLWQLDSWQSGCEAVLLGLMLIGVNYGVFMGKFPQYGFYSHVTYLILPFAIWATYRFGFPGATMSILLTSVIAVGGSMVHLGPFIGPRLPEDLVIVECFIGVVAVTVLSLGAALFERREAEESIKYSEARFRSLVENSYEVVAMVDTRGDVVYTSPPVKSVLDYEPAELDGHNMFDLLHPDDVPQIRPIFVDLVKTPGAVAHAVCRVRRKDGVFRWMEASGCNLLHDPAVKAVVINYRDITERKKFEEIQAHFASIVESSDEAIFSESMDGTIISWNKGAEKLYGYTSEEILGRSVDILVPEDKKAELTAMFENLEEGGKVEMAETIRRRKDGTLIDILLTMSPLHNNGNITGLSSVDRDITERKRAQLAMEESERRFRAMADTAPVMIWMSGADGSYNFFNKAWFTFTGRSSQEEAGNGWRKGIHPEDLSRCNQLYTKAFETRDKFTLDYRLRRADGIYRWVLDTGVPRFNSDGHFAGFIGSCIDITDRKLAEEVLKRDKESLVRLVDERSKELIKTQKELKHFSRLADIGTLAATVAHELRNPLGVIHLAAHNLKREKAELGNNRHLANIEKKVWEGNQIIDNLLSYARIKIPNYEDLRIIPILDECVSAAQARFGEKGIVIEKEYRAGLGTIEADINQVREIFQNILNNACQAFSGPQGKVRLAAGIAGDMLEVSVEDHGAGIAPEDLDKVFEPFFTRKSKGTGLGLTICSELVNLHQGRIDIKSRLGEGTTVTVFLPAQRRNHDQPVADR